MTVAPPARRTLDKADLLPIAQEAQERIAEAATIDELRDVFVDCYGWLGWKALCRIWVLHQTPEEALRLKDHNGRA